MTINFSACVTTAKGGTTSRSYGNRWADYINVKDYGATGGGVSADGSALQSALDSAYGPSSSPHGGSFSLNKPVVIPAGTYLVDQQLFINNVQGAYLLGAGKNATRLVYTGPASNLPVGDVTSLLTCRTMTYSRIEGITFDVTGSNAGVGVQLANWPGVQNDGTGNSWVGCAFVGASQEGFLCTQDGSGQLGSEEIFIGCEWSNCQYGILLNSGNGLDYTLIKPRFTNCVRGIHAPVGAINAIIGGYFSNPSYATFTGSISSATGTVSSGVVTATLTISSGTISGAPQAGQTIIASGLPLGTYITAGSSLSWTVQYNSTFALSVGPESMTASGLDLWLKQAQCPSIVGCYSNSPNFCEAGPVWMAGCTHISSVSGGLFNGRIDNQDQIIATIDGCYGGPNSGIWGNAGHKFYLQGNRFDNPSYLTNLSTNPVENI